MLELPEITLVCIETRHHALARMTVNDFARQVKFAEILIFTDQPALFQPLECDVTFYLVPDWPQKISWSRFYWSGVAPYLRTSYTISTQWDAGLVDPKAWDDRFTDYDYIGAPWLWYNDQRRVGNGGLSLRSTRLCRYLASHLDRYPCINDIDDDTLCRRYRPQLESEGFVWAPESVAERFSFECTKPEHPTFGFHAFYNFGYVLDHDRLLERVMIAAQSPYIRGSWMWAKLLERNPGLLSELS